MNNYKVVDNSENTNEKLRQKFDYETEEIEKNLNQIKDIADFLVQSIQQNDNSLILTYLSHMYEFKNYFKYTACIFNDQLFYFIFSNCIASDSQEIIILAIKILNNLLDTKVNEFTEIIFSSDLLQLIVNFFSSSDMKIKNLSLSTICILSQLDPEKSLAFWDPMLSSVSKESSDIILSYIYNDFLLLKNAPNFNISQLQQIIELIDFSINKSENEQAQFNAFQIIPKGLKEEVYHNLFFEEYSNETWLTFFVKMIHSEGKSNKLIEYGYLILKELVSYLPEDVIHSKNIFDLKLISKQIDFKYDHDTFYQKYDISIVNACFQFLIELFDSKPSIISEVFINYLKEEEEIDDDFMIKLFMIIHHSIFEIREISSQLLCLIIMKGSFNQIASLSMNYIFESFFIILEFDPQRGSIVLDCFSRVLNAFSNAGYKKSEFQIYFEANNASEVFKNLIEYDDGLENQIISICNYIDYNIN